MSAQKPEDKDDIFNRERKANDFKFNNEVVSVFDDMVGRSVPFYQEFQRMIGELGKDFAVPGTRLYDLGCSTGASLIALNPAVHPDVEFIGIDNSREMLQKCEGKLKELGVKRKYQLEFGDLDSGIRIENASVVNMCLTLQFVRPLNRERLLSRIYDGLKPNGCLLLIEKVLGEDSLFNRLFIEHYYDFKRRQNYSDMEISQKREALENVLVPYKLKENETLLKTAGFQYVEVFFKWYNFTGIIAVK